MTLFPLDMKALCTYIFGILAVFLMVLGSSLTAHAQVQFGPGGPNYIYTASMVRGYYFTAPTNFNICQLFVPTTANTNVWHVEVVKFNNNTAPPAWPGTTNAFTSVYYSNNINGTTPITCNIPVAAGEVIGIYGSRSGSPTTTMTNSYNGIQPNTNILGNNVTLYRSGMQFPLNNQQMHDIWSEIQFPTNRIFGFHSCCPTPPAPTGPITGPTNLCSGDTVTYSIPPEAIATSYVWTVPNNATITSGQGTTSIEVVYTGGGAGSVCAALIDTCTQSPDLCVSVTAAQSAVANAGQNRFICLGDSLTLNANVPPVGLEGLWTVTSPIGQNGTFDYDTSNTAVYYPTVSGVHTLRWTVSAPNCVTEFDEIEVTVTEAPEANFSYEPGCQGTPIPFQDLSVGNGSAIGSLYWDMNNDGVNDHYSAPVNHTFAGSGTYSVRLVATNLGCSDTITKPVVVYPAADVSIFSDEKCEGVPNQMTSNVSVGSGGNLDSLIWGFGDGSNKNISTAPTFNNNTSHTYASSGTYTVSLRAVTDQGCEAQATTQAVVFENPVASFSVDNSCQYQTTEFTDESQLAGSSVISTWEWTLNNSGATSNLQNPSYDYNSNGVIPVTLEVESSDGCTDATTVDVEIFPVPVSEFNFSNKVCNGAEVTVEAASTIAYGEITEYEWSVNEDGYTTTGSSFDYTFEDVGNYTVWLRSVSEYGCESSIEKTVPVFERPIAEFKYEDACEDVAIAFRDSSTFSGKIKKYTWNYRDGSAYDTEQYPVHTFDTFGTFNVSFIVESHAGCIDSISYPVKIYERVNPEFTVESDTGCSPFDVVFEDQTIRQTDAELTYNWHYGDGFSREDTAEYAYLNTSGKTRSYDVTLEILSEYGCESSNTISKMITVLSQPVADFSNEPSLEEIKTTDPLVQFSNRSLQANRLKWYFGDGTTSTEVNPSHVFDREGEYEVMLVAKNYLECTDTLKKVALVEHENVPFIPSAFTPNGDGTNDYFYIHGLQDVSDVKMEIFDRWGNQLFSGEGLNTKWDGSNSQSRIVQQGVYVYRVTFTDRFGEEFSYDGNVTVMGVK